MLNSLFKKQKHLKPESLADIQMWLTEQLAKRIKISLNQVRPDQSFVDIGIDSITAVRLVGEIEDWLQIELEPTLLYEYSTVNTLSAYLARQLQIMQSA